MITTPFNIIPDLITHDPNPALLDTPASADLSRKFLNVVLFA